MSEQKAQPLTPEQKAIFDSIPELPPPSITFEDRMRHGAELQDLRTKLAAAIGDHSQNAASFRPKRPGSASKYRGVHKHTPGKPWAVQFWQRGELVYLGVFNDEKEAARRYDREAKKRFGKFAFLNFPKRSIKT